MYFKINKKDLDLKVFNDIADAKSTSITQSHIGFELENGALYIIATDFVTTVTATFKTVEHDGSFKFMLPCLKIKKVIDNCKTKTIKFSMELNKVTVSYGSSKFTFDVPIEPVFPEMIQAPESPSLSIDPKELMHTLKILKTTTRKSLLIESYGCISVLSQKDKLTMFGTTGILIGLAELENFELYTDNRIDFIVGAEEFSLIASLFNDSQVFISITESNIIIDFDNYSISLRRLNIKHAPIFKFRDQFFNNDNGDNIFTVEKSQLLDAVKKVEPFISEELYRLSLNIKKDYLEIKGVDHTSEAVCSIDYKDQPNSEALIFCNFGMFKTTLAACDSIVKFNMPMESSAIMFDLNNIKVWLLLISR